MFEAGRRRGWAHLAAIVAVFGSLVPIGVVSGPHTAEALPGGFVLEDVVTGLGGGVSFDFAPDGRIFIAQKGGVVKVFQDGVLLPTPFIDVSARTNEYNDRGLLDVGVHPEFPTQPYIYLLYTYDPPEADANGGGSAGPDGNGSRVARLTRVTADATQGYNVALAGSETILLGTNSTWANIADPSQKYGSPACETAGVYVRDCLPSDEDSHTIGSLRFREDGSLMVSNGDGSNYLYADENAIRSLDLDSLAGKILRIDPMTGEGLADNPFFDGDPDSNQSKVYDLGLRNPFRFTLHPDTDEPVIGDVGWGTWEEVNTGRGANFGWPCYEGGDTVNLQQGGYSALPECQAFYASGETVTPPIYAYVHEGDGSSIQVGDFYRGTAYPAEYQGALFISDFNRQWIQYLTFDTDGSVASVNEFATEPGTVLIREGLDSNLYLMNIYEGKIKRLRYTSAANNPPIAQASGSPTLGGETSLTVTFSSAGSADPDGDPLTYSWDFGDGTSSIEADPVHTYTSQGVFDAVLTVTDASGATATDTVTIAVGESPPVATIASPADGTTYDIGDTITFSGSATDDTDGELSGSSLSWRVLLHHNDHVHFDTPPMPGTGGTYVASDHGDNTWLELCLTATDSVGLTDQECVLLYPNKVQVTLETDPSGLSLPWEGVARQTPYSVQTNVNAEQQLAAPPSQGCYVFDSWSDGGDRVHLFNVADTPQTYTATYVTDPDCDADLVAYWGLDDGGGGVAVDGSGSGRDGTLVGGPVWSPGRVGQALTFDGVDDRVEVESFDVAGDQLTLAAWVYVAGFNPNDGRILSKAVGTATQDHYWMMSTTDSLGAQRLRFRLKADGSTSTLIAGSASLPADSWVHVAAVYDGAEMRLYQDGVLVGTRAKSGTVTAGTAPVWIGGNPSSTQQLWDGSIDDVRIYDTALGLTEIQDLATGVVVNEAPTVDAGVDQTITLPADATMAGSVSDDGLPQGSVVTSSWSKTAGPGTVSFADDTVLDTSVSFGDPGDYTLTLTATDGEFTVTDTVSVRVKAQNQVPVAVDQTVTTEEDTAVEIVLDATDPDGDPLSFTLESSPSLGSVVLSGGTVTYTPDPDANGADSFTFSVFDGTDTSDIATVSITVAAVNDDPVAQFGITPSSGLAPLTVALDASGSSDVDGTIVGYDWDFGDGTVGQGVTASHEFTTPGTRQITLTVTDDQGGVDSTVESVTVTDPTVDADLVAYWGLDDGGGGVAVDGSGSGRDGTLVGGPVWSPGRVGQALTFDGVDDRVEVESFDVAGDQLTLAAWVYVAGFNPNDGRILSKAVGTATQDHYWMMSTTERAGSQRLRFRLKADGSTSTLIAGSASLPADSWVHVAAVYDGAEMRLYQDGVLVGTRAKSGTVTAGTAPVWIGGNPSSTQQLWDGSIDDVRIYDTALGLTEIQDLATGAP